MTYRNTTGADMPVMECPGCGKEWQWDDYYDVRVGSERECPHCEKTVEVIEAEQVLHCRFAVKASEPSELPEHPNAES